MRIITIDNGNSNPHVGIFQNEKLEKFIPLKDYQKSEGDFILVSDVGQTLSIQPSVDLKSKRHKENNLNLFFEMPFNYSESLGDDRLISSYYVYKKLNKDEKVLLIDAGTFITMDIIDANGFQGGYIFPGIQTFLSTYQRGVKLKPFTEIINIEVTSNELPNCTEDAIVSATHCYIESSLEAVIKKTSPSKIIITGGSSELFYTKLQKLNLPKVQTETNLHLLHSALHLIYQTHLR